jgi:hypothetical protein
VNRKTLFLPRFQLYSAAQKMFIKASVFLNIRAELPYPSGSISPERFSGQKILKNQLSPCCGALGFET